MSRRVFDAYEMIMKGSLRMKFLFLTDEFPPAFGGGIGMYVDTISQLLAQAGHSVTVLTADSIDSVETPETNRTNVRFMRQTGIEALKLGYSITLYKDYLDHTLQLIEQNGSYDIIEVTDFNAIGYYVIQAKYLGEPRLQKSQIVVHCHTPSFEINRIDRNGDMQFPNYWIGQMEKFCLRAADALLTQSEFLKEKLLPYTNGKEITVIPLPYRFGDGKQSYQCGDYLLYTGRLEYRKGVWQMLAQMEMLWEEGIQLPLVLVGGDVFYHPKGQMMGDMIRTRYARWIDQGLLSVRDKVPIDELNRLISDSKAVIIPSLYENYPYTNVIAMSNHVPVVVSRQGGQSEAVLEDGKNGFIFDWEKQNDFYYTIKKMLSYSNEEMIQVGNNGYQRIWQCCCSESNLPVRTSFYEKVINKRHPYSAYPFAQQLAKASLPKNVLQSPCTAGMLSIVIPYYNMEKTIEDTICSILKSNYTNREIILLDDGSTQAESIQKAEEMAEKYSEIQLIRMKNGGLANARNRGSALAKGEFLCFVDSDDTVSPDYFTKCIDILNQYENVSFVYSWMQYFEGSNDIWTTFDTEMPYIAAQNMLPAMAVSRKNEYLAFAHNHTDMNYALEDYDGWLGMIEHGCYGVCIPEPLTQYRVRSDSMARSLSKAAALEMRHQLVLHHPKLYEQYGKELYSLLLFNGTPIHWELPTKGWENSEVEKLRAEINAMKSRKSYRLIDALSRRVYENKIIGYARSHFLTKRKRRI